MTNCCNCKKPAIPMLRKEGEGGLQHEAGTVLGRARIYYCCKRPNTRVALMEMSREDRMLYGESSAYGETRHYKIPK